MYQKNCSLSTFYSHSWHWNQSVSVHWSASSWLIRSSSPHPQQDTSTVLFSSVSVAITLVIGYVIISLLFLSLTGFSIAQFKIIASFFFTFFSSNLLADGACEWTKSSPLKPCACARPALALVLQWHLPATHRTPHSTRRPLRSLSYRMYPS